MIQNTPKPANRQFMWTIFGIGMIVSVSLSIWSIAIDSVINNDGIEYIRAAKFLSEGDWRSAFAAYRWPTYPYLIMLIGNMVGAILPNLEDPYKLAGHVLNTAFFSLAVMLFVAVVRGFGGTSRRITWIAMLVALIHPAFNEYRAFLIRDPGYLAAYLLAVYYLTQCRHQPRLRYRLAVIGSLLAASLFRIEGLVFLFFVPVLFSLVSARPGKSYWTRLLFSVLAIAVLAPILGCWLLVPTGEFNALSLVKDPIEVLTAGWQQIWTGMDGKLEVLREKFLGPYSAGHANTLYGLAVAMVIATSILSELTVPYAALTLYGIWSRLFSRDNALNKLWFNLLLINVTILLGFTVIMVFLAPRYPLATTITLLIVVPFALDKLTKNMRWQRLKKVWWIVVLILALWAVGESYSGVTNYSKDSFLRETGYWLYEKTENRSGPIVTNSRKIAYYAGVQGDREVLVVGRDYFIDSLRHLTHDLGTDFAGVLVQRSEGSIEQALYEAVGSKPVKEFHDKRGDRVLVYDLRNWPD
jgi:hypothetical protein